MRAFTDTCTRSPTGVVLFDALVGASACHLGDIADPAIRPPVALRIRPASGAFNVGEPMDFTAMYVDADSAELGIAHIAKWTSSDTTVATIELGGHFVARCVGSTLIVAVATVGDRTVVGQRTVAVSTVGPACATR